MDKVLVQKKTMGDIKVGVMIANLLGIPLTFLGILINLDNVKSLIIFLLVAVFWAVKIYYSIKKSEQSVKEKEYDLWDREMNKKQRQMDFDKEQNRVNGI